MWNDTVGIDNWVVWVKLDVSIDSLLPKFYRIKSADDGNNEVVGDILAKISLSLKIMKRIYLFAGSIYVCLVQYPCPSNVYHW